MHDVTQAEAILDGIVMQTLVADKAYDAAPLIETKTSEKLGVMLCIKPGIPVFLIGNVITGNPFLN